MQDTEGSIEYSSFTKLLNMEEYVEVPMKLDLLLPNSTPLGQACHVWKHVIYGNNIYPYIQFVSCTMSILYL